MKTTAAIRKALSAGGRSDLYVWTDPTGTPRIVADGHDGGSILYSWEEWEAGDNADYEADEDGNVTCLGEPTGWKLPNPAAVTLGRKGGAAKSDAKTRAVRANATRPRSTKGSFRCTACHKFFHADNSEPVTVGGWYSNAHFEWGRYAGVHTVKAVEVRCPHCGEERELPYPFDAE